MRRWWLSSVLGVVAVNCCSAGLLSRVEAQADKIAEAYGETWNSFYGDGNYKNLMTASLDMRPDGTPNIVFDKAARKMMVTIRLAVNEENYKAWKMATHVRFALASMSFRFSDFEDPEGRMIGGRNYRFGDNEEASIKRWERMDGNGYRAKLSIRVQLVDKEGRALRDDFLPLENFRRIGSASYRYPIPLHNLNRLRDLPCGRFRWIDSDKEPTADSHVEDAYARIVYSKLTQAEMDALEDIRCAVLDEVDMRPIREAVAERERQVLQTKIASAIPTILASMIAIPGENYRMGRTEVTQAQWEAVMGSNPSHFKGPDRPVESVSWNDCQAFIAKLNENPAVRRAKLRFRLPTEEEWGYACRAGGTGAWGRRRNGEEGPLDAMGWYKDNSGGETHPVAEKEPNVWGLYDMHGNVSEWTSTDYDSCRVRRGGSWNFIAWNGAPELRTSSNPDNRYDYVGFRLLAVQDR